MNLRLCHLSIHTGDKIECTVDSVASCGDKIDRAVNFVADTVDSVEVDRLSQLLRALTPYALRVAVC